MNRTLTAFATACLLLGGIAQTKAQLSTTPSGGNKKASVSERVGLTDITIHYDRPGVKGREGKIWGQLVHVGFIDQGFGSAKQAPWRAGSNENTTIEFTTNVSIEEHPLPAGKYGMFIAYGPEECTLIFSKNSNSWGSYYYDEKEDALRVKVKPVALPSSVEWLKYEFLNESEAGATIALEWEKLMIPFRVETDLVNNQLEIFRKELRTDKGFTWNGWEQAASWCLQRNVNLDQALLWADSAASTTFGGDRVFQTHTTRAQILQKLGRNEEADAEMKKALPLGGMFELHQYGRQLLALKKSKEAFDVFKMNYDKNPNQFTTNMGLARGYSALGNYKKALEFAQKALPQAADPNNKANVEKIIKTLQEGKDVNQ